MRGQWLYLLSEAIRGFRSARYLSLSSVLTIGICSSVFAGIMLIYSTSSNLGQKLTEKSEIRIFLKSEFEGYLNTEKITDSLKALPYFQTVDFISQDMALKEFEKDFGSEMLDELETNPLPSSWILSLKDSMAGYSYHSDISNQLSNLNAIEAVSDQSQYLAWLEKWKNPVQYGSILLMVLLGGALSIIIHTAIRLNLYARKELVVNMQYFGASKSLMMGPFILEGFFLGLAGALFGAITLYIGTWTVKWLLPSLSQELAWGKDALILLLFCGGLSALTSFRSVLGFLKDQKEP